MSKAIPMPDCYSPSRCEVIDGRNWMQFTNNGTYKEFCAMPLAMKFEDKIYFKRGFNSDNCTVSYATDKVARKV